MKVTIVGAGMAGLLCGNLLKGSPFPVRVVEAQKTLPNNHSAVLRFRTPAVGEALGIPFRKVMMIKDTLSHSNPVADALAYSLKNSGVRRSDRSITQGLVVSERFIAPSDLITRMAAPLKIEYGHYWQPQPDGGPVISTLPMPVLMEVLKYPQRETFSYVSGINIKAKVANCDAYVTLMVPDPNQAFSRISITGDEMIVEVPNFNFNGFTSDEGTKLLLELGRANAVNAARLFGFTSDQISDVTVHKQSYAKIVPINDDARKEFIYWATHEHNTFSLGRFATWRPHLLLDDLLKDIKLINSWVNTNSRYAVARHR